MDSSIFKNKNIVIGITGGIACYKTLDIIKELKKLNANVNVIMTQHATKLADIEDFQNASGNEVHTDLFHPNINYIGYKKKNKPIKHISLADIADIFLICPATANIIGKIANGIADDLLSTSVMATNASVLICPAMNVKMWKNPIVQENVSKLKKLNYHFAEPEYGELACGYKGVGRLANLNSIVERIYLLLKQKSDFKGKKILVTAGPTSEEIDPVRVITNKSSGKMGAAIAEQAFLRGADVILLRNKHSKEPNLNIKEDYFYSVNDLFSKIKKYIPDTDIVIHTAAVSDFTLNNKQNKKMKSSEKLHLELEPTTKIFEKLKKQKNFHMHASELGSPRSQITGNFFVNDFFLVGFKAEYNVSERDLIDSAYKLLKNANADLVVANDVGKKESGFDSDFNEVFIVDKEGNNKHHKLSHKRIIADFILDEIKNGM